MFPTRLETERLLLQRWDAARDTPGFVALCQDPEVMRFLGGPAAPTVAATKSDAFERHWEMYGFGLWAARRRDGAGELLGFVGLSHPLWLPGWEDVVEVGWRLRRDAWGNGYATEGARAAVEHAAAVRIETAGDAGGPLRRLHAFVDPRNTASVAVAERLGLECRDRIAHPRTGEADDVYVLDLA